MNNFTGDASHLIFVISQETGKRFGSEELLPEHLMVAMIENKFSKGYVILEKLSINIENLLKEISDSLVIKEPKDIEIVLPNSRRLSQVFDLALIESQALGSKFIGTEHLLLGCLREPDSVTYRFFQGEGISLSKVRETVKALEPLSKEKQNSLDEKTSLLSDYLFGDFFKNPSSKNSFSSVNKNDSSSIENSIFSQYTKDLTKLSKEGLLEPTVARNDIIEQVIQILSRKIKNNPLLIGEPGVGKTAIIESLAKMISTGNVPRSLMNKKILSLDLTALVAGTKYRGDFEERMKKLIDEVKKNKNVIIFVDEFHSIIGSGAPEGQMDAANILKPALGRSEIQMIGATTQKEYMRYIEKDSALERRFQIVKVSEPSDEECISILNGIKGQYEKFHHVFYEENVIPSIVKLSKRYVPEKFLPDKAIDLLDEAGALRKIKEETHPKELEELEEEINRLDNEKKLLVKNQDYETAAVIRDKVNSLRHKLELYVNFWSEVSPSKYPHVTEQDVSFVIHKHTGIPVENLDSSETKKLISLEKVLSESVVGQSEAVSVLASSVRRNRVGISSANRPIGSFVFLGPTGVGKTKLAKTLAKFLFGSEDHLVRIDMSDYMEKHNASRLVGSPPGYVGFENGGILTEKIRKNPYSVVLLDEIEKAHPDIFNLLLQLLEEGELQDNLGHTVNFRNTIIIMTSNAGSKNIMNEGVAGFTSNMGNILDKKELESVSKKELKKIMSPEFLNRIDDIIVFNPLSKTEIEKIVLLQLDELKERLSEKNISIFFSDNLKAFLTEKGYEPSLGARPLRRLIQKELEDRIANLILESESSSFKTIFADFNGENVCVNFKDESSDENKTEVFHSVEENSKNLNF